MLSYKSAAAVRSTQIYYCITRTDSQKTDDSPGSGELNLKSTWIY